MTIRHIAAKYRSTRHANKAIQRTRMGALTLLWVTAIVFTYLTPNCASAAGYSILVLPFSAEKDSEPNDWIGYSLGLEINAKLAHTPGVNSWFLDNMQQYFDYDGIKLNTRAYQDKELNDLSKTCYVTRIVAGRYKLNSGQVQVKYRVWREGQVSDNAIDFTLADAPRVVGVISLQVAKQCGLNLTQEQIKIIKKPDANSLKSMELQAKSLRAYYAERDKEALKFADKLAKVDPDSALAAYRQAYIRDSDDHSETIYWLRRSTKADPSDTFAWYYLGLALIDNNDLVKGRKALIMSIRLDPSNPFVYVELATVEFENGRKLEAKKLLEKASALVDGPIENMLLAEDIYWNDIDLRRAIMHYHTALKLGAPPCRTLTGLGDVHFDLEEWNDAVLAWEKALELQPNDVYLLRWTAVALGYLKQYSKAEEYLKKAIKFDPKDPGPPYSLGWVYMNQGKFQEAEIQLEKSLSLDPKDEYAHKLLSHTYYKQRKYLHAFKEAISASPRQRRRFGIIGFVLLVGFTLTAVFITRSIRRSLAPDGPIDKHRKINT